METKNSTPILVAEHIDKRFGITHAVNDVSLTIAPGEIRALIGQGESKSSAIRKTAEKYGMSKNELYRKYFTEEHE